MVDSESFCAAGAGRHREEAAVDASGAGEFVMATYFTELQEYGLLSAEQENSCSAIIRDNFQEIIRLVLDSNSDLLGELKGKIRQLQQEGKTSVPRQRILSEIRQSVDKAVKSSPNDENNVSLQGSIHAHLLQIFSARDTMIHANLRLVVSIAKRCQRKGLPLADLIQEGNLGLARAVLRFNHEKGNRFATYARWWIRQAIDGAIAVKTRTIRLPIHICNQTSRFYRSFNELQAELGRMPTLDEVSLATDIPLEKIRKIQAFNMETVSLEAPVGEDGKELNYFLKDETAASPCQQIMSKELFRGLHDVLSMLSERERTVIFLRFGFNDHGKHTLQEIGDKFKVTRECIRLTEKRALQRIRTDDQISHLQCYLFC